MNFIKSLFKEKSGQANLSASAPLVAKLEHPSGTGLPSGMGGCTPVPTVFDNYCHTFIRQTIRTGLQTPSSPKH